MFPWRCLAIVLVTSGCWMQARHSPVSWYLLPTITMDPAPLKSKRSTCTTSCARTYIVNLSHLACPTSAQPHKPGRTSCAQARVYSGVSRRFLSDTLMSVLPTSSWFTHSSKPVRRQHQYVANSLHMPKTHSTHRQVTNSATRYGDSLGVSSSRTT
ncbi:hypothetical protein V8E55_011559 [Tylopilus felleus]